MPSVSARRWKGHLIPARPAPKPQRPHLVNGDKALGLLQQMEKTSAQPRSVSLHRNERLPDSAPMRMEFVILPEPSGSKTCQVSR